MADYKKPDYWQLKAQDEGYPARSVYKLKEIDEKFGLLKSRSGSGRAFRVLDLGAAPGSWSLYVLRKMPGVPMIAADLSPLSHQYDRGLFNSGGFVFIQGDITEAPVRDSIVARGPFSLIISDAAPSTTGNRIVDTSRSLELAEAVVAYAESSLAPGGNMIFKLFQGGDIADLAKRMKELFTTVKSYKPTACRSESFETYCLGLGLRRQ